MKSSRSARLERYIAVMGVVIWKALFLLVKKESVVFNHKSGEKDVFARRHFGVPVCWPGSVLHDNASDYPAHVFARYFRWEFIEAGPF